jgi:hypothetical protein
MTAQDRKEFKAYLVSCTDQQVYGVLEKESDAGRKGYAELAQRELEHRGLEWRSRVQH